MKKCFCLCSQFGGFLKIVALEKNEKHEVQDELEGIWPYTFAPSVTKKKSINGNSYTVRRYFLGGKDFAETMERLAARQIYKETK